jgi:hypothetical protein
MGDRGRIPRAPPAPRESTHASVVALARHRRPDRLSGLFAPGPERETEALLARNGLWQETSSLTPPFLWRYSVGGTTTISGLCR